MPTIVENFRDQSDLREEFFEFTQAVFPSLDFTEWYREGYWNDAYIPFSILDEGKIISNVSISEMQIYLNGEIKKAIQFATVGTRPEYRKQGLSRILMNHVFEKYKNDYEFYFLFSNDTVTEFYPKFGFKRFDEVYFQRTKNIPEPLNSASVLSLKQPDHKNLVEKLINNRAPISKLFSAIDYGFITWWYIFNFHSKDLHYLPDEKIIFIVSEAGDELDIWDVIFEQPIDFENVLPKILKNNKIKKINFYFSPDVLKFHYNKTIKFNDSPLFIKGSFDPANDNFKFPYTAQT